MELKCFWAEYRLLWIDCAKPVKYHFLPLSPNTEIGPFSPFALESHRLYSTPSNMKLGSIVTSLFQDAFELKECHLFLSTSGSRDGEASMLRPNTVLLAQYPKQMRFTLQTVINKWKIQACPSSGLQTNSLHSFLVYSWKTREQERWGQPGNVMPLKKIVFEKCYDMS